MDGSVPPAARTRLCSHCEKDRPIELFDRRPQTLRLYSTCNPCRKRQSQLRAGAKRMLGRPPKLDDMPPRVNRWTLLQRKPYLGRAQGKYGYCVDAACDCGFTRAHPSWAWRAGKISKGCRRCVAAERWANYEPVSGVDPRAQRKPRLELHDRRERLTWSEDEEARAFVEEHPGGATLEEVGEFFGVSRERVRQIEADALRKIRRADVGGGLRRTMDDILQDRPGPTGWFNGLSWDELPSPDGRE